MLKQKQIDSVKCHLTAQGVNAWHIADYDAPPIMRDFARSIAQSDDYHDTESRMDITPVQWSLGANSQWFRLLRYKVDRSQAFLALQPTATWRVLGWSESDFDIEGCEEEDQRFALLKDEYDGADMTGNAPQFMEDLDSDVLLREFAVAIKRVRHSRNNAAMKQWLPALHAEQKGRCADCGCIIKQKHCAMDHIVPFAWGGDDSKANLRVVCPDCNSRRSDAKHEMTAAWMHDAGLWKDGWTPAEFDVPAPDPVAAWEAVRPVSIGNALAGGPVENRSAARALGRRRKKAHAERAKARAAHDGLPFVPFKEREHVWDRWPEIIASDPMRYAGKDDYEFLAALGSPILCGDGRYSPPCKPGCNRKDCDSNDPKRRQRLRRRLHDILKKLGWGFGRYDEELDEDGEPTATPRRYMPPDCDIKAVMGEGFYMGDLCSGNGTVEIRLGLDENGMPIIQPGSERLDSVLKMESEPESILPSPASPDVMKGLRIAITGKFNGITRNEVSTLIESGGGTVTSSITSKTDCIIVGEKPGSKLTKAQDRGIGVRDLDGLRDLLLGRPSS